MKLYTVGPVEMHRETLAIGGQQVPYFRNEAFSGVVKHTTSMIKETVNADPSSEVVLLTCSGTGGLESVVMNFFNKNDRVLIVDGGSFGHRFVQLCELHNVPHSVCVVPRGETLSRTMLEEAAGDEKLTGLLVNIHETSIGQLYDKKLLSDFCKERDILFCVDAISSYLADELDLQKYGIDVMIASSQKAPALAPGLTFVVVGPKALKKMESVPAQTMYFDFRDYIKNGERGQTPFTPAIRVIYELENRLETILNNGVEKTIEETALLAKDFRERLKKIGLSYPEYPLSNFETPVWFPEEIGDAVDVYMKLEKEYGIVVNPSGGDLAHRQFRVGHIGNHSIKDNEEIIAAIKSIIEEN